MVGAASGAGGGEVFTGTLGTTGAERGDLSRGFDLLDSDDFAAYGGKP